MTAARVSVALPFRDAATTLTECLRSIEAQTLRDFEVVAVDDGSTDDSLEIVRAFSARDARFRLASTSERGIVAALNHAMHIATAPLIARMDADDRMHPTRLEQQLRLLEHHSEIDVVGSLVRLFPEEELNAGYREYARWLNACVTPEQIEGERFFESPLAHPSVTFRREVVMAAGGYRHGDFPEDYELWLRLMEQGVRCAKVPEVLLEWRESARRASRVDDRYAREAFDRIRAQYLGRYLQRIVRPVCVWGAGRRTRQRIAPLLEAGFRPATWIDVDPRKIGRELGGVAVREKEWLAAHDCFVLVCVTNHGARDEIGAYLQSLGRVQFRDWIAVG